MKSYVRIMLIVGVFLLSFGTVACHWQPEESFPHESLSTKESFVHHEEEKTHSNDTVYTTFNVTTELNTYETDIDKIKLILIACKPGKVFKYDSMCAMYRLDEEEEIFVAISGNELLWYTDVPPSDEYATVSIDFYMGNGSIEFVPGKYRIYFVNFKDHYIDFELVAPESD